MDSAENLLHLWDFLISLPISPKRGHVCPCKARSASCYGAPVCLKSGRLPWMCTKSGPLNTTGCYLHDEVYLRDSVNYEILLVPQPPYQSHMNRLMNRHDTCETSPHALQFSFSSVFFSTKEGTDNFVATHTVTGYRASWWSCNSPDLYSGGAWFDSQLHGHNFSMVFLTTPSRQMPGQSLNWGHEYFLPNKSFLVRPITIQHYIRVEFSWRVNWDLSTLTHISLQSR